MAKYRKGSHTLYDIKYHFVWITKYRYQALKAIRPDHVHLLIACLPQLSPSKIVQYLKGRPSRLIQGEFPQLKQHYWGQYLWARGYFCGTVGTVTDEMIREYIENMKTKGDRIQVPSKSFFTTIYIMRFGH